MYQIKGRTLADKGLYLHDLLQFRDTDEPDVYEIGPADFDDINEDPLFGDPLWVLASVIINFSHLVVEDKTKFWASVRAGESVEKYLTPTDLAFAFLVLEHNVIKWRHQLDFRLNTGKNPSLDYCAGLSSLLLYKNGIAGEAAKNRFERLNQYFFRAFFNPALPEARKKNLAELNGIIFDWANENKDYIHRQWKKGNYAVFDAREIAEDIIHRVFHYMY